MTVKELTIMLPLLLVSTLAGAVFMFVGVRVGIAAQIPWLAEFLHEPEASLAGSFVELTPPWLFVLLSLVVNLAAFLSMRQTRSESTRRSRIKRLRAADRSLN